MKDITADADKFDEVLRRLLNSKPTSKEEISAKIKAQKELRRAPKQVRDKIVAAKAANRVQKMDKIKKYAEANKKGKTDKRS
jgi:response regulator RpfG family c-di-GMP phosphodiesterase